MATMIFDIIFMVTFAIGMEYIIIKGKPESK